MKAKELVTIREKKLQGGGSSLFLDYTVNGVRHKEYLKLYIIPEHGKIDKLKNQEARKAAAALKAKRIIALQSGEVGLPKRRQDMLLTAFLADRSDYYIREGKSGYANVINGIKGKIEDWNPRVTLQSLDKRQLLNFCSYMKGVGLSDGTTYNYYQTLGTQFKTARRERMILTSPFDEVTKQEKPKQPETEREYLTLSELRQLLDTPCADDEVKRMFMFCCFTGIRLSDAISLTWKQIHQTEAGLQLEKRQIKTRSMAYIPLSENAVSFLGTISGQTGRVFHVPSVVNIEKHIKNWTEAAGIDKHITFHCSRHSCATLLLTAGVDIYTTSKLLGHKKLSTTAIYAKIIDEKKVAAVNAIPKL